MYLYALIYFDRFIKGGGIKGIGGVNVKLIPIIQLYILQRILFSVKMVLHKGKHVKDEMYAYISVKFGYLPFVYLPSGPMPHI